MKLRKGKAVEWVVYRKWKDGTLDFWESASSEREARKVFKDKYAGSEDGSTFVLLKLTYEQVVPQSGEEK